MTLKNTTVLDFEKSENGYYFNPSERRRLSIEFQSIFEKIVVNESHRKEIKDLKKDSWMVKRV
jgi:hypothetical protein